MDRIWAFQQVKNGLLFFRHTDIFLTHVVVTKDITSHLSHLKGCWADLALIQCRMVKEATVCCKPSCFAQEGYKWYLEALARRKAREAVRSLMTFHCIFHLRRPVSIVLLVLGK